MSAIFLLMVILAVPLKVVTPLTILDYASIVKLYWLTIVLILSTYSQQLGLLATKSNWNDSVQYVVIFCSCMNRSLWHMFVPVSNQTNTILLFYSQKPTNRYGHFEVAIGFVIHYILWSLICFTMLNGMGIHHSDGLPYIMPRHSIYPLGSYQMHPGRLMLIST